MNNIQKAFKNKAQRGLRMAIGGLLAPGRGNDLTRSRQMGEAASEMERTRLASEADFRKRMSTPPVTAARGPLDNQVAMGEAMAGLSNTDRYKLGGSGTAAEASEIDQRNDIMKRLNAAMPEVPQMQVNRQPRPGLLGGQDELLGMNLARGTGSLNCASGVVFRDGNSFSDRPMMPASVLRPQRPVPTLVAPQAAVSPQRVAIPLPAPEYPQERARPVAVAATPPGTYPGVAGVPGLLRARSAANIDARDYADGGLLDKIIRTVGRVLPDSNGQKYEPGIQSRAAEDPARHGRAEALNPRTQSTSSETPPAGGFQEEAERRRKQMREAMEYACGTARVGHAAGGIVRGKGGPTDDQVPMSVGGTDVNLSPREAVLPVKTVMALGGPGAVEDLIERTNGKPPVRSGLRAGGNYADGVAPELDPLRYRRVAVPSVRRATAPAASGMPSIDYSATQVPRVTAAPELVRADAIPFENPRFGATAPVAPQGIALEPMPQVQAPRSTIPVQDGVRMPAAQAGQNFTMPRTLPVPYTGVDQTVTLRNAAGARAALPPAPLTGEAIDVNKVLADSAAARQNANLSAGMRTAQALRAAENSRGSAAALSASQSARALPMDAVSTNPSVAKQAFNTAGGIGNKTLGQAAEATGQAVVKGATQALPYVKPVAKVVGGTLKAVPYAAGAIDATDVIDVATDPNKTKLDVGQEVANKAGKWGAAGAGAGLGAKVGAAGGSFFGPIGTAAGGALGALVGGVGGYLTADELMRAGGGAPPSETADGLTSGIKRSIREKLGIELPGDAAFKTDAPTTAAPAGQSQAPTTAVPVGQPQAPTTAATAADIQARSMAAEGLRGFAQRRMNLPPTQQQDVVNGGSLVQRGNVGLRAIGSDQGTMNALNEAHWQQGTGVVYSTVKGADGKPQVMISGGQPTKPQYIAADGTPTNDWKQTAQYAESKGLHARNKQALRDIEMENARGDMASALPFYQGRGLRTMATRLREDEIAQKGAITPAQAAQLAMQREGLDATIANRAEDNARADAAARAGESEAHRKATDDLIKSWATTDGKPDEQKYAFLQKYASQFERPQGMSSAEHLGNLMDNFAIDTMGDTEGRHWLSAEGTWNGERTKWQKRAAKDSLRRGAPLQSVEYHDPLTGRTIYQSDVNKLSPNQRKLFESRVYQ